MRVILLYMKLNMLNRPIIPGRVIPLLAVVLCAFLLIIMATFDDDSVVGNSECTKPSLLDYRTDKCVNPASQSERARLGLYDYLGRLALKGDQLVESRVNFSAPMTPSSVDELLPRAGAGVQLGVASVSVKTEKWTMTFGVDLAGAGTVNGVLKSRLKKRIAEYLTLQDSKTAKEEESVLDVAVGLDRIELNNIKVYATPSAMRNFWKSSADQIACVQPLADALDRAMLPYCP